MCALYQFSLKKVELIQKKLKSGQSAPTPDKRGQHSNRSQKMSEYVEICITEQIQRFPAEQSQYSRNKNCHKMYLSPLLNITQMYRMYIEECKEKKLRDHFMVKLTSYRKIFSNKFNLSFGQPKSDTCSVCD